MQIKKPQNLLLNILILVAAVAVLFAGFLGVQYFERRHTPADAPQLSEEQQTLINLNLSSATPQPLTKAQQDAIMSNLSQ